MQNPTTISPRHNSLCSTRDIDSAFLVCIQAMAMMRLTEAAQELAYIHIRLEMDVIYKIDTYVRSLLLSPIREEIHSLPSKALIQMSLGPHLVLNGAVIKINTDVVAGEDSQELGYTFVECLQRAGIQYIPNRMDDDKLWLMYNARCHVVDQFDTNYDRREYLRKECLAIERSGLEVPLLPWAEVFDKDVPALHGDSDDDDSSSSGTVDLLESVDPYDAPYWHVTWHMHNALIEAAPHDVIASFVDPSRGFAVFKLLSNGALYRLPMEFPFL